MKCFRLLLTKILPKKQSLEQLLHRQVMRQFMILALILYIYIWLAIFVSLVPTRITFVGYVIVILGA